MQVSASVRPAGQGFSTPSWLAGGGELGGLMRAKDWTTTPLGPVETWPQSLRTAVSILLNSRHPMFLAWGPQLGFLYNDGYAPIFGAKHPAALGRPFAEVWSEIWEDIRPLVERALRGEPTWSENLQLFMERNGYPEEVYFTFSYSPIYDETGGVGGMFCACTETTAAVLGERRLRTLNELSAAAAAAQARTVAETEALCLKALDGDRADVPFALFYRVDAGGRMALAGSAGLAVGNALASGAAEDHPWPLGVPATGATEITDLSRYFPEAPRTAWGDPVRMAVILPVPRRDLGEPAALVLGINPRRAFDAAYRLFLERVAGAVATATANALAFEAERRRGEQLAELDRAKTAFFSNVSHEFRTPLSLMLGPLEELKGELGRMSAPLAGAHYRQVDLIHRNGLRLLKLVNTLLDFSRIEAGRAQAAYEPTDLAAYTAELASLFRSAMEKAGLKFSVDCPALPEPAFVDREMWEKIVLNLLSNAFKFTFAGKIEVKLRKSGPRFELAVRDTGTGIAAEEVPKLFERFHRVAGAVGRTHEGSGIGLAFVQELARLHGGSVSVESVHGKGSIFRVTIPAGSSHLPQQQIGTRRPQATPSPGAGAQPFIEEALRWLPEAGGARERVSEEGVILVPAAAGGGERPHILLADDNADMRDYVRHLLGARYEVETVTDGEAALAAIDRRLPALVLADIMMPRVDGQALLARLRADPRTRTLPIILVSARAGEEARMEGLAAGADDYLIKPFSARELASRIGSTLQLAKLRKEADAQLREKQTLLTRLIEQLPVGVGLIGADGRVLLKNAQMSRFVSNVIPSREDAEYARWRGYRADGRRIDWEDYPASRALRGELDPGTEYHYLHDDGSESWTRVNAVPLRGAAGEIAGAIWVIDDISATKQAEDALRRSEQQYRLITDAMPALISYIDRDQRYRTVNKAYELWFGHAREEVIGKTMTEVLGQAAMERLSPYVEQALRGQHARFEAETPYREGGTRWIAADYIPHRSSDGAVAGFFVLVLDISERRRTEDALRESEHRFRHMANSAPVMIWVTEADGSCSFLSETWYAFTGQTSETGLGFGWLDCTHPDDRAAARAAFLAANAKREPFRLEYRLHRRDGEYRWALDAASPRLAADGSFLGYIGSVIDISERKRAEETQRLLLAELSHRVKNTLASVQAIVQHTLRSTRNPEEFAQNFTGRIQSLSRVHSLLSDKTWQGADLRDVIRDQLSLGAADETRVTAWGPAVHLEPQLALHIALMLHELATNSHKYGALSRPDGSVSISWKIDDEDLHLDWIERGGPPVQAPTRRGFGMTLIEQSAQGEGGYARLLIETAGVAWKITLPLPRRSANIAHVLTASTPATPPAREPAVEDSATPVLAGMRLIVIEDEPLVALDIVAGLKDAGAEVFGPVGNAADALRMIGHTALDGALLDGNLHGKPVGDIAAALVRVNVPFLFVSGYGRDALPQGFGKVAILSKPFSREQMLEAVAQLARKVSSVVRLRD
jgi:PAS domain S-box-containing protein